MVTYDNKIIGRNLQEARKTAGYTQKEVAEKIDVGITSMSLWEHGHLSITVNNLMAMMNLYANRWPEGLEPPSMDDILGFRPVEIQTPSGQKLHVSPRDAMMIKFASLPLPMFLDDDEL